MNPPHQPPSYHEADPFDLPDWLGESPVTWEAERGLATGHRVAGALRADGHEPFVQNAYLRASERKLSYSTNNVMHTPSTLLNPVPSMLSSDVQPMPAGKYVRVAIPLYYEGHVYRAGTRIRVTIAGVNGAQPIWSFSHAAPASDMAVRFSPTMPSMLVLPVVWGVDAQGTSQPPCPAFSPTASRSSIPTAIFWRAATAISRTSSRAPTAKRSASTTKRALRAASRR